MQRIELEEEALMEEEKEKKPHLVNLPSFGDDDDDEGEFEFVIAGAGSDPAPAITADEIFSDGRILPSYPLFNLDLLHPATSGSTSSSEEEEDGGFCEWEPERRAKKSASTGSSCSSPARRWRIRDLMVGRSSSDGKDKFLFLSSSPNPNPNPNPNPSAKKKKETKGTKGAVKEMDLVTAHNLYYAKGGGRGGGGGDRGRRSFLPYRQELFGFFGTRNHHPF